MRPWLLYTGGAMGVGKGYVLSWMSDNGFFPLESLVSCDPDAFRASFPEWNEYVRRDKLKAGDLTQREAGYISEIAQVEKSPPLLP